MQSGVRSRTQVDFQRQFIKVDNVKRCESFLNHGGTAREHRSAAYRLFPRVPFYFPRHANAKLPDEASRF